MTEQLNILDEGGGKECNRPIVIVCTASNESLSK